MKYRLVGLALCTACLSPVAHSVATRFAGCTPERTMFFAYTKNGTKAVEFCEVEKGYRYSYGPINQPELQLTKQHGEIGRFASKSGWGFAMKNDNLFYYVSVERYGSTLVVSRGDGYSNSPLARIPLDMHGPGSISRAAQTRYAEFEY